MKKVLIVVDMQNDFIDGALGTKEAVALVPRIVKKIEEFDGDVLATLDTHKENYIETQEGKRLPVKHCIKGTTGHCLNYDVRKMLYSKVENPIIIEKPTFGSFELIDRIADIKDAEEIELCGLCTDICVVNNALMLKAAYPEMKIVVDSSLTEGVTPETKEAALTTMKMCQVEVK